MAEHRCLVCGEVMDDHDGDEDHKYLPSLRQIVDEHDPEAEN